MQQSIVAEVADKIFANLGSPRLAIDAEDAAWRDTLWRTLEDSGLTLAWVPEDLGGSGATLADGFEIAAVAGRFALSVPLIETLLAGWLLAAAAIASPQGPMAVAPCRPQQRLRLDDGMVSGRATRVPFGREAQHIVVHADRDGQPVVALLAAGACRVEEGIDLSGDPRDTVIFENAVPLAVAEVDFDTDRVLLMGSVLRSLQTASALKAALDLSVDYAGERTAFGKPIGKFQAVQINLARLAGEVSAANAAATSAADAIASAESWDDGVFLEAVAAKIRSAEAAEKGFLIAHQVHGAIGVTDEHVLHRYSLRAMGWRDDFGNESYWARALGRRIAAEGPARLWELVAAR